MKKTQIAWIFIFAIVVIFPVVFSSRADNPLLLITSAIILVILLLFFRLTLKVDDHYVRYVFGIGLIRGKYALENIESCSAVRDKFLGWGIKFSPDATIYNIAGRYAIELKIRDQEKPVLIGTNQPEKFAGYIESKLIKSSGKQVGEKQGPVEDK
ncbi:MAG TPA: hypothetical protein VE870_02805 [Bacteroidales bacterium]|nr:hypothetical protein [Bacteroidales bacterium]